MKASDLIGKGLARVWRIRCYLARFNLAERVE